MNYIPSQDQVMAQLRIIIPALGTMATAFGISGVQANSYEQMALVAIGPISYVIVAIWSAAANTRKSIMLAAAKPATPGGEKPQIILPASEAGLAQKLPGNVNTTETVIVVPK